MTHQPPDVEPVVRDHWWWRPGWRLGRRAYTFHITFDDAAVEGAGEVRRLAASYQRRLGDVGGLDMVPLPCALLAPFQLTFDQVDVRAEAIAFRPSPSEPVATLRDTVRSAIAAVRGTVPEAPEHAYGFQPHVSLAYVNAPGPAVPLVEAVDSLREASVSVLVRAASLIVPDRDERVYRWTTYATIPLGSSPPP